MVVLSTLLLIIISRVLTLPAVILGPFLAYAWLRRAHHPLLALRVSLGLVTSLLVLGPILDLLLALIHNAGVPRLSSGGRFHGLLHGAGNWRIVAILMADVTLSSVLRRGDLLGWLSVLLLTSRVSGSLLLGGLATVVIDVLGSEIGDS